MADKRCDLSSPIAVAVKTRTEISHHAPIIIKQHRLSGIVVKKFPFGRCTPIEVQEVQVLTECCLKVIIKKLRDGLIAEILRNYVNLATQ